MYICNSITSYDRPSKRENHSLGANPIHINMQGANTSVLISNQANIRNYFEFEYARLNKLGWKNIYDTERNIHNTSQYSRLRSKGVKTAWDYEKTSIKLGGKGSAGWNKAERTQILKNGKVKGAQGHHQMNVHDHPDFMAEASNIKFYRSNKEHLQEGHGGNFRNESNKEFIDKDRMLIHNYERRLLKQEAYAFVFAAVFGFTLSSSLTIIADYAENGIDPKRAKQTLLKATKEGALGAGSSLLYYGGYRIGGLAVEGLANYLSVSGKTLNFLKSSSGKIAIIGGLIIIGDSVWQTSKDLNRGIGLGESLYKSAQKQAVPAALLTLTCFAPKVGAVATVIFMGYDYTKSFIESRLRKKIEIYTIDCLYSQAERKLINRE